MNQKELYIQYLEDALNHAKTGEPMKHWQTRYIGPVTDRESMPKLGWLDVSIYCLFNVKYYELRIKPEPFKWTTFAFKPKDCPTVHHASHKDYVSKENICERLRISLDELLAVHHHEIETE